MNQVMYSNVTFTELERLGRGGDELAVTEIGRRVIFEDYYIVAPPVHTAVYCDECGNGIDVVISVDEIVEL